MTNDLAGTIAKQLNEQKAAQVPTSELLARLLAVAARQAALAAMESDIRAVLTARALQVKETDGVAPTWRAAGLGVVTFTDPQAKVAVTDHGVFTAWAARAHPEATTLSMSVPGDQADAVLAALDGLDAGVDHVTTVDPRWSRPFLERCASVDGEVFAPESGEVVPGTGLTRPAPCVLQVRLNPEAKARAAAECVDEATVALFTAELGSLPRRVELAEDLQASGEPDEVEL